MTQLTRLLASLLLLTAACGDDDDDGMDDAVDDQTDDVTPDATPARERAVVVAGDFAAGAPGVLSALDVEARTVMTNIAPAGAISSDPIVRKVGDSLYVVNRFGANNLTILDATTFASEAQIATGENSNPQDVAVVGNKLYLPALGTAGVVVATRGSSAPTTIALDIDPDGVPDCVSAFAVGTDVYVACGTLDETFTARGPGTVVVIDSVSDTVRAMFTLKNANPVGVFEQLPDGSLVIATVPTFGGTDGCLERVMPGALPTTGDCLVTNAALGGYAARTAVYPGQLDVSALLWIAVSAYPAGKLMGFDLSTSSLWSEPISPATQIISDVTVCPSGKIVVADTTETANGLRVYADTAEVTTAPLAVGIVPKSTHGLVCY